MLPARAANCAMANARPGRSRGPSRMRWRTDQHEGHEAHEGISERLIDIVCQPDCVGWHRRRGLLIDSLARSVVLVVPFMVPCRTHHTHMRERCVLPPEEYPVRECTGSMHEASSELHAQFASCFRSKGMTDVRDQWAAGSSYEDFVGRWGRRLALRFVSWPGSPRGVHWLDVGCGTGSLVDAICAQAEPATVVLEDVRCESLEIPTAFVSFEDYWRPFLVGTGPAPSYVASLTDERRAALARRLKDTLRQGPDGAIALTARAWTVRGTVNR